jgi:hypothetical protein
MRAYILSMELSSFRSIRFNPDRDSFDNFITNEKIMWFTEVFTLMH